MNPFATVSNNLPNVTDNKSVGKDLFNGNIRAMLVKIPKLGDANVYIYRYDHLNGITAMNTYTGLSGNSFTAVGNDNYRERISYDGNGNILTFLRNGDAARLALDKMTYTYKANTNQLDKVVDAAADDLPNYAKYNDIKQGQTNGNYQYDEIGNLTSYAAVDGYHQQLKDTMSIYSMTDTLKQKEINLYDSRLGIYHVDIDVQNCNIAPPEITKFTRGNKSYELSNHLGNVLVTISDKHVQVAASGNIAVDYYLAEVLTATDYYPFGMQMPQRQYYIDTTTYIVGTTTTTTSENNTTVVELYKHSFNDTPSVHPYVTVPNTLNVNLNNSIWTNSRSMWTNYASNTSMGKTIAFDNSTSDTSTVTLTLNIASNKKVGIKSFSFYNRVSNSGYRHWKMFINGIEVGDSLLY